MTGTLADIGEFELIAEITQGAPSGPDVMVGPGDDAAVLDLGAGPVVTSTDALVEGVHFKTNWSSAHDVGRRAVAGNVADLEAMGATARFLLVALSAPASTPIDWVRDFAAGLAAECAAAGVLLVGGDTTAGPVISAAITVLGAPAPGGALVTRAGARAGQVVAVCGRLGWAAAGLGALRRGFRSPGKAVQAYRVPEVPYGQGRVAAAAGAGAMIDVSDGLLADLGHLARASGVGIDLDPTAFPLPDPVVVVAQATGADALGLVLTGGEDHALAATFDPGAVPPGWWTVGRVTGVAADGPVVLVGGAPWSEPGGWDHFR